MVNLEALKKKISEKKQKEEKPVQAEEQIDLGVDIEKVEQIVQKMRKKYQTEGFEFGTVEGELGELRDIITEGKAKEIEVQKEEELKEFGSDFVKKIGGIYVWAKKLLAPLGKIVIKLPPVETLSYYLFSANMRYSVRQYIAITVTVSTIISLIVFAGSGVLIGISNLDIVWKVFLPVILAVWFFFLSSIIILLVPKRKAIFRGNAISRELPFALRHISTELRSGIGLYRTMQAIATSDYGVLSEEFAKTITEIEEGTDTKDALTRMALRNQSKALRNALMHLVRVLKTGGNISEIMNTIAQDVGFELRMKIRDFAQRMNFFGVLFIFIAIWTPVIVSILGAVRNSGFSSGTVSLKAIPLPSEMIALLYLVVFPLLLVILIAYIIGSQPRV